MFLHDFHYSRPGSLCVYNNFHDKIIFYLSFKRPKRKFPNSFGPEDGHPTGPYVSEKRAKYDKKHYNISSYFQGHREHYSGTPLDTQDSQDNQDFQGVFGNQGAKGGETHPTFQ